MDEPLRGLLVPHSHDNNPLPNFILGHPTRLEHRNHRRHKRGVSKDYLRSAILPLKPKLPRSIRAIRQRRLEPGRDRPKQRKRPSKAVRAEDQHRVPPRELHSSQLVRENVPETPSEGETSGLELCACDGASGRRVDEGGCCTWDLAVDFSLKDESEERLVGDCNVGNGRAVDGHGSGSSEE